MLVHSYPLLLSLYKGEGRILIVPLLDHIAGYSIDAEWYESVSDMDDANEIGGSVIEANQYIIHSMKKSEKRKGAYAGVIKEVVLPIDASAEKIGESVIDTFLASEKFYGK